MSLKGQAKKVLLPMGNKSSVHGILDRLERVFGNVAACESVMPVILVRSWFVRASLTVNERSVMLMLIMLSCKKMKTLVKQTRGTGEKAPRVLVRQLNYFTHID